MATEKEVINQVDELFAEAQDCMEAKIKKQYLSEIKVLMEERKAAERVLKNIEHKESMLRTRLEDELNG